MLDDVARAICKEAGKQQKLLPTGENVGFGVCTFCDAGRCTRLPEFRSEAYEAIKAAYQWHKRERRWPQSVTR